MWNHGAEVRKFLKKIKISMVLACTTNLLKVKVS